ncbi:Armadillo-like helical [Artemisia annua]|uniref:Armadillo-like helical n=1 Tax=Artemisia annua TaxID=35608 RepID=A0A2U1L9U6_ARTAN|nr:Armadillo-like helical [Artemisia annua]
MKKEHSCVSKTNIMQYIRLKTQNNMHVSKEAHPYFINIAVPLDNNLNFKKTSNLQKDAKKPTYAYTLFWRYFFYAAVVKIVIEIYREHEELSFIDMVAAQQSTIVFQVALRDLNSYRWKEESYQWHGINKTTYQSSVVGWESEPKVGILDKGLFVVAAHCWEGYIKTIDALNNGAVPTITSVWQRAFVEGIKEEVVLFPPHVLSLIGAREVGQNLITEITDSETEAAHWLDTPNRKKSSEEEWEEFTEDSTIKAFAQLASSPEFTDWVIRICDTNLLNCIVMVVVNELRLRDDLKSNQQELVAALNLLMLCCKKRENSLIVESLTMEANESGNINMIQNALTVSNEEAGAREQSFILWVEDDFSSSKKSDIPRYVRLRDDLKSNQQELVAALNLLMLCCKKRENNLIVESLTMEANESGNINMTQNALTVSKEEAGAGEQAKEIVLMFLGRLSHPVGLKTSSKQMVANILPCLTYVDEDKFLWQKTQDIILENGITEVAVRHLTDRFAFTGEAGFKSRPEWHSGLKIPFVPLILSMLSGLSMGHLATQKRLTLEASDGLQNAQRIWPPMIEGMAMETNVAFGCRTQWKEPYSKPSTMKLNYNHGKSSKKSSNVYLKVQMSMREKIYSVERRYGLEYCICVHSKSSFYDNLERSLDRVCKMVKAI